MSEKPKTRIVLTITELCVGGAEKCLTNLATRLDRTRYEPRVIVIDAEPPAGQLSLLNELTEADVPVHFIGATHATRILFAVRQMSRLLREIQPDVVQSFLFHANVVTAMAAKFAAVGPVLAGIRVADPSRWRLFVERRLRNRFDRFVCVSDQVARQLSQSIPAAEDKIEVIPNGIDPQPIAPIDKAALGLDPSRQLVVFVGRLTEQKGLDKLFPQLPHVFAKFPNVDLALVGDGDQRESLQELAEDLGIQSRIHFLGWRADAQSIIATAELLVLPSRWEGMPNVVLEAMAQGKPVVANNCEGIKQLLGSYPQQVVNDSNGLADRLIEMLDNEDLRSACGMSNLACVREHFSVKSMVQSYQAMFDKVVNQR